MNKIINGSNKYLLIIEMLVVISIVLSITYSNYFVESSNHRAAEMYIGSLKYSMKIDSNETNTLSLKPGVTVIDVDVNNLNPVDTYYKLLYLNNSNLEIKYFSETKDTDEVKTSYKSPNDSVTSSNTNNLKLFIRNNSDTNQDVSFSLKGGYINNTLSDISVPSGYSEITIDNSSNNTYFCKTSDTLTQGLEYVNGQYTYGYMKEGHNSSSGLAWSNISNDGWGVQLTDKASTDAITSKICSYINNKPLVSAAGTFNKSKATILNLDGLNTSNIINMNGMFSNTQITTLDVSKFNTSNVKDMGWMFSGSQATALDLSNFNTSNVTNMEGMFNKSEATALDLSNFNTSNVTNMRWMFSNSQATTLDLSNFNTSNVTNMEEMFYKSQATTLDVSSFNTSNVTNMKYMFGNIPAITIDVSKFNTSKVTNMYAMFYRSQITTLDLSSFDTSNVTDMSFMFNNSIKLKTIYASNKFKTDLVTSSSNMFYNSTLLVGGSGTTYNSSYVDKTYARIDGGTSRPGYFTDIANKPSTFGTDDWATIVNSVKAGNTNHYKVGDTKIVNLGTYGTHTIRVSNTTTPSECSNTNFSQSACGFVLEFEDIITTHVINTTSSNKNGWPASSMRTFVNNDIYNALPADLRNGIINTTTISSHGSSDSANFLSTDKLYLLATAELYENGEDIDTAKNLTRQLDYYKSIGVTINSYSGAIKKSGTTATDWWLRSFYKTNNQHVYSVLRTGRVAHSMASLSIGVSPAFRID
ncbi:putative uncharacterized protein [Clostridium sp. CAG:524]|jgi:surface protein|nr:putative uncharacterized protein [Clostridium sp. CAG:524]